MLRRTRLMRGAVPQKEKVNPERSQTGSLKRLVNVLDWVVVSNMFYFHPDPWADDPT